MEWKDIVLTLGLSLIFGLPTLGFGMYWTAEFLGLKVDRRKQALAQGDTGHLQEQLQALQQRVAELEQSGERVLELENQIDFLHRLLERPDEPMLLPQGTGGRRESSRSGLP